MAASDGPNGSSLRKSPQKMAVCAWAGETQTFRATDPSCHDTPCHVHSVLLSTDPAFCGIPHLALLRLIWSHRPPLQSLRVPLGAGTRWQNPQPRGSSMGAWRRWEIGIGTPGKGHGWPSSGWECRKMKRAMTAAGFFNWSSCWGRMGCVFTNSSRGLPGRPRRLADIRCAPTEPLSLEVECKSAVWEVVRGDQTLGLGVRETGARHLFSADLP